MTLAISPIGLDFIRGQAAIEKLCQMRSADAYAAGSFSKVGFLAAKNYPVGGCLFLSLSITRRPSAVFRFVIAIIVDAIDRSSRVWLQSHVGMVVLKAGPPTLTDTNASAPVSGVSRALERIAAAKHLAPHAVFLRSTHAVGGIPSANFEAPTATTNDPSLNKMINPDCGRIATVTLADPVGLLGPDSMEGDRDKAAKPPASDIFDHRSNLEQLDTVVKGE